jgi:adenine nucleotide transporter 17
VVQTSQAVRTLDVSPADSSHPKVIEKKLGFIETVKNILAKDGAGAFWRGIGPALVLVINPVLQYTVFEQLKNILIKRRTAKLRASGLATAIAVLSDWDFFFLGALSKLGMTIKHKSQFPMSLSFVSQSPPLARILICASFSVIIINRNS